MPAFAGWFSTGPLWSVAYSVHPRAGGVPSAWLEARFP